MLNPNSSMMRMFTQVSEKVNEIALSASEDPVLAKLAPGTLKRKSICPISDDGRLIVTGFLGENQNVKVPNSNKSLQRVSLAEVKSHVQMKNGPRSSLMVWNLSGERYDYADIEVVEHNLGIHPAPSLEILQRLVDEVVSWLEDDVNNIAVLHDLSGRRSAVVAACCLFVVEPGIKQSEVFAKIGNSLGAPGRALVPSQRRYIEYFAQQLSMPKVDRAPRGRLAPSPQRLERIIVNGIPDYVNESNRGPQLPIVCRPCAKVFLGTETVAGTLPGPSYTPEEMCFSLVPLSPFPGSSEGSISNPGVDVDGDVLVRVYNVQEDTQRPVPMFALAFHTSFVHNGVLRARAEEIDGAKENGRFPLSFFVDLIFRKQENDMDGILQATPVPQSENRLRISQEKESAKQPDATIHIDDEGDMGAEEEDEVYMTKETTLERDDAKRIAPGKLQESSPMVDDELDDIEKLVEDLALDNLDLDEDFSSHNQGNVAAAVAAGSKPRAKKPDAENGDDGNSSDEAHDDDDLDLESFDIDAFASSLDLDFQNEADDYKGDDI
mmetsp:Transcript_2025/g.4572  ORF Transcript_2025/g.4572 Transcript_2025/m.4572 type:complete len:550 (-) Transcript_2025:1264-2913(-)|eukprot:CAMPEP_0171572292 /NCGR_PEP_ID=MMETSP0961-20121227/4046_1 /TAXON_ID=87120 /ORGANISM="Aurantiochytrium limacinum, Strain ATCCMYA-1381" /LENGTH=549 /DNA_ID=CAMNT_0012127131 /DNA_START=185 /DNA_END=1834 /DNA_ORIENTATION=+